MTNNLEDEIRALVTGMENQERQDATQPPQNDIQDVYVLIVREQEEDHTQIVDSIPLVPTQPAPVTMQHDSFLSAYVFVCCSLFLVLSTLAFQLYCLQNPLIATITILPTSQHVTLSGTMHLGRVLLPLTISQSQTTPATGHGHQPAAQATGYLTFYNGQFQSVTIAARTILTGSSGVPIVTDQDATIPAANPPNFGQVTIAAHSMSAGVRGNIPAYDINQACCAISVLVKNATSFTGGQDERDFSTVTTQDIHKFSTPLKISVAQSMQSAFVGQLRNGEQLQMLPCSPTVRSNHQPGAQATQVTVTVSETCSAVAYSSQELAAKATGYLATQARKKLAGYSLFGTVNIAVTQATVNSTTPPLVFLSFKATGTWIYGLSTKAQERIKNLIAGKNTQQAQHIVAALPGVAQATIQFSGFGDDIRLPKSIENIHLTIIIV